MPPTHRQKKASGRFESYFGMHEIHDPVKDKVYVLLQRHEPVQIANGEGHLVEQALPHRFDGRQCAVHVLYLVRRGHALDAMAQNLHDEAGRVEAIVSHHLFRLVARSVGAVPGRMESVHGEHNRDVCRGRGLLAIRAKQATAAQAEGLERMAVSALTGWEGMKAGVQYCKDSVTCQSGEGRPLAGGGGGSGDDDEPDDEVVSGLLLAAS